MDLGNLIRNYGEAVAMILFGIGFSNLLLQKNLIKKIIGLNIMDTTTPTQIFSGRIRPLLRMAPGVPRGITLSR